MYTYKSFYFSENISDQMKDNFREILLLYSKGISATKFSAVYKVILTEMFVFFLL